MSNRTHDLRKSALHSLLRPIVRFCLRSSYTAQDLFEAAKEIFVQIAAEELTSTGEKINRSRLSIVTGLRRPEIRRILESRPPERTEGSHSLLARVMLQWRNDREFSLEPGEPRPLSYRGPNAEFRKLCNKVSTTLNPGTVQFDFERRGFAVREGKSLVLKFRQLPLTDMPAESFSILGKDLDGLVQAVEENLLSTAPITNLHLRTEFDNIVPRFIPTIRRWLMDEGKDFHRRIRNFLAQFDKDLNPDLSGEEGRARVAATAFSLTDLASDWKSASPSNPQSSQSSD